MAEVTEATSPDDALAWESLGTRPAGQAFRAGLLDLLLRPQEFFRRMALDGGLHEPLTFFAIMWMLAVVLAFPAALAHFGLTHPDPARTAAEAYQAYTYPARATGLMLALLPVTVPVGAIAWLLLATLGHAAGKPFGTRNWEGTVSIWLYSGGCALVPVIAAEAAAFAVSLAGYLLGLAVNGLQPPAAQVAQWVAAAAGLVAVLGATALLLRNLVVGYAVAFAMEAATGVAGAIAGVLAAGLALGGVIGASAQWGLRGGAPAAAACALLAGAVAGAARRAARRHAPEPVAGQAPR